MRVELQPAYILHRRPYRNTSAILEIFSHDYGRIGLVARGLQNHRHRKGMQALLQPFSRVLLGWTGRGELKTLTHAETQNGNILFSPRTTASLFYLNELLIRLLQRDDPHENLFLRYEASLQRLFDCDNSRDEGIILRIFEKSLLDELGYGLVLDCDANSNKRIVKDEEYRYIPDMGPVKNSPTLTGGIRVHGESLLALASEEFLSDRSMRESKQLMRYILRGYLGDKPLQSRLLYNKVY